jgi:hypothetical protein
MPSITRKTVYFTSEGRVNLPETLRVVTSRVKKPDISQVVIFTRDGEAALKLREMLPPSKTVIAATFPAHQPFHDKEGNRISHELANPKLRSRLQSKGIPVAIGTMPLSDVILPKAEDTKLAGINNALKLFGGGVGLCIQGVLMATDAGLVTPGETVAALCADTGLVVRASSSAYLFHPKEGLSVLEIICKYSPVSVDAEE